MPRLGFLAGLVAVYGLLYFVVGSIEKPYFFGFIYGLASALVFAICFFTWWWRNRAITRSEKFLGFILIVGGGFAAGKFSDLTVNFFTLSVIGLPLVVALVLGWLFLVKRALLP